MTESDTERKEKEMAKAGKFNLTDLLNSRSKELEEVSGGQQEKSEAGQQDNAPQQEEENAVINIDVHNLVPSQENFYIAAVTCKPPGKRQIQSDCGA